MSTANGRVLELQRIAHWPIDLDVPFFYHYAALKLGLCQSSRYYADLLVPIVRTLITAQSKTTRWVLTSPPLRRIATSANLLCWDLRARLEGRLPATVMPSCVDLFFQDRSAANRVDPGNYSLMNLPQRVRVRQNEGKPHIRRQDFQGRAVVVVNDMRVTGTQERYLASYLAAANPVAVYWLYLINIDPTIAYKQPAIEHTINQYGLASYADFARIMADPAVHYTHQCLARLFSYSMVQLDDILKRMDPVRAARLFTLVEADASFDTAALAPKLALLRSYAAHSGNDRKLSYAGGVSYLRH